MRRFCSLILISESYLFASLIPCLFLSLSRSFSLLLNFSLSQVQGLSTTLSLASGSGARFLAFVSMDDDFAADISRSPLLMPP